MSEVSFWIKKLSPLHSEIIRKKLASSYDLELISTYNYITQEEFCKKILGGWTLKQCMSWYNSY